MNKPSMRRRITPSIPFVLDVQDESGKQSIALQLAYDLDAFTLVEEALGKSMLTDIGELLDNPSAKSVSVLLWAAVQLHHEEEFGGYAGLRSIRNLLTIATAPAALEACSSAYLTQLPPEQVERLKKIQTARKTGEQAPPLASSPASTE